jgi:lysozyme
MAYLDTNARTVGVPTNDKFQPLGRSNSLFGVFRGFVKRADDVQKMGRLQVWIPEFGSAPAIEEGWITVSYCSPFAGSTNTATASKADIKQFEGTETSYGMWMVTPDVNTQVLVMFINGESDKGIWIGSLYNQFMNNMVPAMAASTDNYQYNGKYIPVAEYNKWDTSVVQPDATTKPYESTKFKGVGNQGLINDIQRGVTSTSARRESPSKVFGIITPGPVIDESATPENIRRKGGSSFIMDDLTGSEYVKLATKSGAQITLNETTGEVYLINRDGTAWVQMDQYGNIDIFGATNISMRAQRDVNIRADRNVNIEAGQNIYMKAAKDTTETTTTFTYDVNNVPKPSTIPYWKYVGEGKGQGGNIVTQALNSTHTTVKNNAYITVDVNMEIKVGGTIDTSAALHNLTASVITNEGAVKIGSGNTGTLDVTGAVAFGSTLGVLNGINAASGSFLGNVTGDQGLFYSIPGVQDGSGATPKAGPGTAGSSVTITPPDPPISAEVKPMLDKMNILAVWKDPESKFKRNAEAMSTTVTRLPTYESCPEHETFTYKAVSGYTPKLNEGDKTYEGSGGAGNTPPPTVPVNTTPGANNTEIPQESPADSVVTKDFNMAAYQCQLKIHEGVKYVSYLDSVGLPTGGIGHLLRSNEVPLYPVPTPILESQVATWFNQDAPTSIKGAQELLGIDVWGDLSDVRKRACADLCYNMGKGRLSKFTRFIAGMKSGDWNLAGASLRDSKWFTQVGRRGPNIITMVVQNVDPNGCDKKFPA